MQNFFYIILIFSFVSCAPLPHGEESQQLPEGSGQLILDISGLRNSDGEIFLSLYSGKNGFPNDPDVAVVNRHQDIVDQKCLIEIDNLPYGEYAVSLLHDENRDGKMDSSMLGIPKEGFGFSGNPKTKMGPPDYDDVRFLLLVPEKRLEIVVQYETVGRERQRIMQERKAR